MKYRVLVHLKTLRPYTDRENPEFLTLYSDYTDIVRVCRKGREQTIRSRGREAQQGWVTPLVAPLSTWREHRNRGIVEDNARFDSAAEMKRLRESRNNNWKYLKQHRRPIAWVSWIRCSRTCTSNLTPTSSDLSKEYLSDCQYDKRVLRETTRRESNKQKTRRYVYR